MKANIIRSKIPENNTTEVNTATARVRCSWLDEVEVKDEGGRNSGTIVELILTHMLNKTKQLVAKMHMQNLCRGV